MKAWKEYSKANLTLCMKKTINFIMSNTVKSSKIHFCRVNSVDLAMYITAGGIVLGSLALAATGVKVGLEAKDANSVSGSLNSAPALRADR
jgi:hypothetical protein